MNYLLLDASGTLKGCIRSALPSMKNSRRLVTPNAYGGRTISIKSEKAMDFVEKVKDAYWEAVSKRELEPSQVPLTGNLKITATVYQDSMRRDLDIELLCDSLEDAGLIANDRQFWEKHSYRRIDRTNPRVEFTVERTEAGE
jgi:Holliday junction resolvase RusA-like endonuclease